MPKDLFTKIKDFPHHLGIFATFTIDNDVVEKLREHSVARMYIMHDIQHGVTALATHGGRLCIRPAQMSRNAAAGSIAKFHPKVVLLVGNNKVALGMGSANLTRDSFQKPKETFTWIEVDRKNAELDLLIQWLQRFSAHGWGGVFKEVSISGASKKRENTWRFLNNRTDPLGEQILRCIRKDWKLDTKKSSVHVVSPFLSRDSKNNILKWFESSGSQKKYVYARKNRSAKVLADTGITVKFPERKKKREGFHSKQVMFEWPEKNMAILYIGSANFTNQGFFLSEENGGNAECGILMVLRDERYRTWKKVWFETGWDVGRLLTQARPEDLPDTEADDFGVAPYCWAETDEGGRTITLWIACAGEQKVAIIKPRLFKPGFVRNKTLDMLFCHIKRSTLRFSDDEDVYITVKIGNREEIKVPVLVREDFDHAYQQDGSGLFGAENAMHRRKPLYSVSEIRDYYNGQNDGTVRYLKPAALDKFHQLWRVRIENIRHKSYFSMQHFDELKKILARLSPAERLYVIYHLRKITLKYKDRELSSYLASQERYSATEVFDNEDNSRWVGFNRKMTERKR